MTQTVQTKTYRADLPPMPDRIKRLPVQNGYPVPWFVAKVDGVYDFRIADGDKFQQAMRHKKCWICGERLGANLSWPIGPMCAINRTISEPPSHRDCAIWSAIACPFLAERNEERRTTNLPENIEEPGGCPIKENPKGIAVWSTRKYQPFKVDGKWLFQLGDPTEVLWYKQGRSATREEIAESIKRGLPRLMEMAELEGQQAIDELHIMCEAVEGLMPAA